MGKKPLMKSLFKPFVITVKTDNTGTSTDTQFTLPTRGGYTYLYDVETSDGQNITGNIGSLTITFPASGTYDIRIKGKFPTIYFANGGDRQKIVDIKNWGSQRWEILSQSFQGCSQLTSFTAVDAPKLLDVDDMGIMFQACTNLNTNIDHWKVKDVVNMRNFLKLCPNFNQPLNSWTLENVNNMQEFFNGASSFNQPLSNWDLEGVINMSQVFNGATNFNQNISSWDVTSATSLSNFMLGVTLSTVNYDALLIAWDAQGVMSYSGTVNFGGSQYTSGGAAEAARTSLIAKWGGITDGGGV